MLDKSSGDLVANTSVNFRLKKSLLAGVALIAALIFIDHAFANNFANNKTDQGINQNAQFLLQLQSLRQELADLRNQVEQQGYQLRQLNRDKGVQSPALGSISSSSNGASSIASDGSFHSNSQYLTDSNTQVVTNSGKTESENINQNNELVNSASSSSNTSGRVNFPLSPQGINQNQNQNQNQSQANQQVSSTQNPIASELNSRQINVLEKGNRGIQTNLNELDMYNKGIIKLNAQEYKSAASIFSAQIQNFPKGEKTGDAYFWLAETFYILGDLASSSKSYQSLVMLFPQHTRSPKALVKLVGIQQERGEINMAKSALNNLLRNYANSSEASLAKSKFAGLL